MRWYPTVVTTLGFLAIVVFAGGLGLLIGLAGSRSRARLVDAVRGQIRHPITWAWLLALAATSASLYLSEIVGLVPCALCWYQRFAMYPLVLVLGVGAWLADGRVWRFGLPLSVVGLGIAIYHVTIQWRPTLQVVSSCSEGAPCTGRYVAVFGFISIPTMAGAVFLAVSALLLLLLAVERSDRASRPDA